MDFKVSNFVVVKDRFFIEVHLIKEVKSKSLVTSNSYLSFSTLEKTKKTLIDYQANPYHSCNRVLKEDVAFTSDSIDEICTFIYKVHILNQKLTEIQTIYDTFRHATYTNLEQATEAFNKAKSTMEGNSDWATYVI